MAKTLAGIKAVFVQNTLTGQIIRLDNISTESAFTNETIEVESTTGVIYGGEIWTAEVFAFINPATTAPLRQWAENDTPIILSAVGTQANFFWHEPIILTSAELIITVNARDGLDRVSLKIEKIGAFPDIIYARNMFKAIAKYPFEKKAVATGVNYRAKRQEGTTSTATRDKGTTVLRSGGSPTMTYTAFAPFVGTTLTFGSNLVSDSFRRMRLEILDNSNNIIQSEEIEPTVASGVSSGSLTITNNAAVKVRIVFLGNTTFENVWVRTDNLNGFING